MLSIGKLTYINALSNTVDTVSKVGYGMRPLVPIEQLFLSLLTINSIFFFAHFDHRVKSLQITNKPIYEFIREAQEDFAYFIHDLKTKKA